MRLLHTRTFQLVNVPSHELHPYAILSHTWGSSDDEVLFEDIEAGPERAREKASFAKLQYTATEAIKDGLEYCWIDTCCIDKKSSAELQEAINSMFTWYRAAKICYIYLSDVTDATSVEGEDSQFRKARWHTRGWTLQELLAPQETKFFTCDWTFIGTKSSFSALLSDITRISVNILNGTIAITTASIAQRMAWAARRETSRSEDLAYCLMGIFSVNMPMLYGEGERAFLRLQYEISKESNDNSIFAWQNVDGIEDVNVGHGLLAEHPRHFRDSWKVSSVGEAIDFGTASFIASTSFTMLNQGIQMESYLLTLRGRTPVMLILILRCRIIEGPDVDKGHLGILVQRTQLPGLGMVYVRVRPDILVLSKYRPFLTKSIMLAKSGRHDWRYLNDFPVCRYELQPMHYKNSRKILQQLNVAPVYISEGSLTSWRVVAWTALHRLTDKIESHERKCLGPITFDRDDGKDFTMQLAIYKDVEARRFFPNEITSYDGQVSFVEESKTEKWSRVGTRLDCGEEHMVHVYVDSFSDTTMQKQYSSYLDFTFLIRITPL
jgi:hypothetical protein